MMRESVMRARAQHQAVASYLEQRFPETRQFLSWARSELRDVVLVLGSPRGGTSAFKSVLAAHRDALAMQGEHRPLLTLQGLCWPDHGGPDECTAAPLEEATRRAILDGMALDCGIPTTPTTRHELERFGWHWALRFVLQWPDLHVDAEQIVAHVCDTLSTTDMTVGAPTLTLEVVAGLRQRGLPVDPWCYDISPTAISARFPTLSPPRAPPSSTILEITPFVCPQPTSPRPRPGPLVLKASSDPYRLPLLRELFRDWRQHYLHLTRNPMASINGLLDGWAHPAFWQHDIGVPGPDRSAFWKFDLVEGWPALRTRPLRQVCARQWAEPHHRILEHLTPDDRVLRIRFEDFVAGPGPRHALFQSVAHFCALAPDDGPLDQACAAPRIVNRSVAPTQGRWKARSPSLVELLPDLTDIATALGYPPKARSSWP